MGEPRERRAWLSPIKHGSYKNTSKHLAYWWWVSKVSGVLKTTYAPKHRCFTHVLALTLSSTLALWTKAPMRTWQRVTLSKRVICWTLHTSLLVLVDQRGKRGVCVYLTRTKRSAGNFLHWHSLTKGPTIERSWIGTGPGTFLPSSTTANIAGWPLCPGRPASIHWERKWGGEKTKEKGFYWLPTMCKPLCQVLWVRHPGTKRPCRHTLAAPSWGERLGLPHLYPSA